GMVQCLGPEQQVGRGGLQEHGRRLPHAVAVPVQPFDAGDVRPDLLQRAGAVGKRGGGGAGEREPRPPRVIAEEHVAIEVSRIEPTSKHSAPPRRVPSPPRTPPTATARRPHPSPAPRRTRCTRSPAGPDRASPWLCAPSAAPTRSTPRPAAIPIR